MSNIRGCSRCSKRKPNWDELLAPRRSEAGLAKRDYSRNNLAEFNMVSDPDAQGRPADEGIGFHDMLVFFFFALVELLGKVILHTHLADGM